MDADGIWFAHSDVEVEEPPNPLSFGSVYSLTRDKVLTPRPLRVQDPVLKHIFSMIVPIELAVRYFDGRIHILASLDSETNMYSQMCRNAIWIFDPDDELDEQTNQFESDQYEHLTIGENLIPIPPSRPRQNEDIS